MKYFAIIGVGGYIAPRHLDAIKDTGNQVVAAYDPNDSVGILDRYFPDCQFFTEFERFESFLDSLKGSAQQVDYLSICSPNYLHASHIKFALSHGAHAICEKPLVLTVAELEELLKYQQRFSKKIYTVLQLRLHDAILDLKKKIENENRHDYNITLIYQTVRGQWYHESWKGDAKKSGGLSTNIGVHFFDMLTWIFGSARNINSEVRTPNYEKGSLQLERAHVEWSVTIDRQRLDPAAEKQGKTTFRCIKIDGTEFEFSEGFTELHKHVYQDILSGHGYGIEDSRAAIEIVERLRG